MIPLSPMWPLIAFPKLPKTHFSSICIRVLFGIKASSHKCFEEVSLNSHSCAVCMRHGRDIMDATQTRKDATAMPRRCEMVATRSRHGCDAGATWQQECQMAAPQMQHVCDRNEARVQHGYDMVATRMRRGCDVGATWMRHSCDMDGHACVQQQHL